MTTPFVFVRHEDFVMLSREHTNAIPILGCQKGEPRWSAIGPQRRLLHRSNRRQWGVSGHAEGAAVAACTSVDRATHF